MKVFIDAKDCIAGRVAAFAAKQALLGHEVAIYNAEAAVVTGKRTAILEHWRRKNKMGVWSKGPFIPKVADRFMRRIVRGMLPYKTPRGLAAFRRVLCYKGKPDAMGTATAIPRAHITASGAVNYISINDICRGLGGKA